MKKTLFLTIAVLASTVLFGQRVVPVNIAVAEYNLDSLRTALADQPNMYIIELQRILSELQVNKEQLKLADKQLKEEETFFKEVEAESKDAVNAAKRRVKLYETENKEMNKMISSLEKQEKSIRKLSTIDVESRETHLSYLGVKHHDLMEEINRVKANVRMAEKEEQNALTHMNELAHFKTEMQQKTTDLKQLHDTQKAREEAIKAELKLANQNLKK